MPFQRSYLLAQLLSTFNNFALVMEQITATAIQLQIFFNNRNTHAIIKFITATTAILNYISTTYPLYINPHSIQFLNITIKYQDDKKNMKTSIKKLKNYISCKQYNKFDSIPTDIF